MDCTGWKRIMRNDFFPGNYIGQKHGDNAFEAWHIEYLGADLGWGDTGQVLIGTPWPFGMSENYDPWP